MKVEVCGEVEEAKSFQTLLQREQSGDQNDKHAFTCNHYHMTCMSWFYGRSENIHFVCWISR